MTYWELLGTQNSSFGCWDDVIQGTGRNLSSPHSSTACVSQGLQSTAASCYFRKQVSIILLILQFDCWHFQQSRGQILYNVFVVRTGRWLNTFTFSSVWTAPEVAVAFLTDDIPSFCLRQLPPSPDIRSSSASLFRDQIASFRTSPLPKGYQGAIGNGRIVLLTRVSLANYTFHLRITPRLSSRSDQLCVCSLRNHKQLEKTH